MAWCHFERMDVGLLLCSKKGLICLCAMSRFKDEVEGVIEKLGRDAVLNNGLQILFCSGEGSVILLK